MLFRWLGGRAAVAAAVVGLFASACSSSKATQGNKRDAGTDSGKDAGRDSATESGGDSGPDSGVQNYDWPTYAGSASRLFFAARETSLTPQNVAKLKVKWQYKVGAALTASPIVVNLALPGGTQPIVFVQSWDLGMNAIRLSDGSRLWRFVAEDQPGANYPGVGSAHFAMINGKPRIFFGSGEALYCLDAITGKEIWRFYAGTGCKGSASNDGGTSEAGSSDAGGEAGSNEAGTDAGNNSAGLCSFTGERNEIESSPIIADGNVLFGMDINDSDLGKGGFYAVDAQTGKLSWFFDVDSGKTCRPNPGDNVDHFDGYHSAAQLGLPANFFSTRSGCNFDRTVNGCSNVWSSVAINPKRSLMFFVTGNCNVDNDPNTPAPPPPGPANEDAIVSLHFDGTEAWAWRPRLTCPDGTFNCINADLDFGATPNLFSINVPGQSGPVDVVGTGDKSGTYYVIDQTGVNAASGVKWNDADASKLPYWTKKLVPGGSAGGIIGTTAVDPTTHRIYISTAPGANPLQPQEPSEDALDANNGNVIWQNTNEPAPPDASYGPTTATPSLVFAGSMFGSLRIFDAQTGKRVAKIPGPHVADPIASGIVVYDGIVLVGQGIGERNGDPNDPANAQWQIPSQLTAYCVPGSPGC